MQLEYQTKSPSENSRTPSMLRSRMFILMKSGKSPKIIFIVNIIEHDKKKFKNWIAIIFN